MIWQPKEIPSGVYVAGKNTDLPEEITVKDLTDDHDYIVIDQSNQKEHLITKSNFKQHYKKQTAPAAATK